MLNDRCYNASRGYNPSMAKRIVFPVMALLLLSGAVLAAWYYPYRLDYGDLKNGVYHNAYFRLRLPVENWFPMDLETAKWREEVLREPGKPGTDPPARPPAGSKPNIHLVTVYDQGWGQPGQFNASLFIFAEKKGAKPGVDGAEEYLRTVVSDMIVQHPEVSVAEPLVLAKAAGQWMPRMRVEMRDPAGKVYRQEYYSVMRRGYYLSVVLSWEKPEDRHRLQNLMDGLRFR